MSEYTVNFINITNYRIHYSYSIFFLQENILSEEAAIYFVYYDIVTGIGFHECGTVEAWRRIFDKRGRDRCDMYSREY